MNIFSLFTASVTAVLLLLLLLLLVVSSVEMENNLGTLFLSRIAAINFDESSILPSAAAAAVLFGATLPMII